MFEGKCAFVSIDNRYSKGSDDEELDPSTNTGRDLHPQILAQGGLKMSCTVVKKQAYILLNPSFHLGQNYRYKQQDFCYIAVRKTVFY